MENQPEWCAFGVSSPFDIKYFPLVTVNKLPREGIRSTVHNTRAIWTYVLFGRTLPWPRTIGHEGIFVYKLSESMLTCLFGF